jgi:signal transduction histidine kinase
MRLLGRIDTLFFRYFPRLLPHRVQRESTIEKQLLPQGDSRRSSDQRGIRFKLKIIFSCLTGIPFIVFTFIYFRGETLTTALSGFIVALALILVLEGFLIFRKMADHVEELSSTMQNITDGKAERVHDKGETKELAIIAEAFNNTLSKLEETARQLGLRALQASTLYEIKEIVSKTINIEEIAKVILLRAMKAVNSQAGYLAIRQKSSTILYVQAASGKGKKIPSKIVLDESRTLAGLAFYRKSAIIIDDIEKEPHLKELNRPDIGATRLLYLPLVAKGSSIGMLVLGRGKIQPHFSKEDIQFLQVMLQQVAYSVENARLYENLRYSKRELEGALSSQKKAQVQLLASARMAAFGELSVNIAHELNNPLTGVLGYTDLILGSPLEMSQVKELLEKIRTQTVRAGNITKGLLDLSSIQSSSKVRTDLNALVKKTLYLARGRMLESGINLDLRLADKSLSIIADQAQVGQALFNLVANALKAMTEKNTKSPRFVKKDDSRKRRKHILCIESGERDHRVYVSFKDTGDGIPPEHLASMFEPFHLPEDIRSQVGLSLWVTDKIIKAHGGSIHVKSILGKGSIFAVTLPAAG